MDAYVSTAPRWLISLAEDVRVTGRDGADETPRSRKIRAIIALLLVSPDHSITRRDLTALLWSNRGPEQARASLRQSLFMLRTDLPAFVEADSDRVWLLDGSVVLDDIRTAQPSLSQLSGLDPAFDRWLSERAQVLRPDVRPVAPITDQTAAPTLLRRFRWAIGSAIAGAVIAALAVPRLLHQPARPLDGMPIIAVVPFEARPRTPSGTIIALRMSNELRTLLPSDRAVVRVSDVVGDRLQQARRLGAEWVISGSVEPKDNAGKVHIQVETPDGRLIWGRDVDAAPGRLADAAAIAMTRMAMATGCALGGPRVHRDIDVLGLLFAGCERLDFSADYYNDAEALVALRRLADRAPDDALAQAYLGTALAVTAEAMPADVAAAQRAEAVGRLDRALRLDQRVGEAWVGRFALVSDDRAYQAKETLLAQGLAVEPNNPMLNLFMGCLLFSVGRGEEGLVFAQRAAALAPAYLASAQTAAGMLSAGGRPREALGLLDVADRRFPRNARQAWQRLDALLTSGDTVAARALLDRADDIPGFLEPAREAEFRRLTYAIDAPHGPLADAVARDAIAAAEKKPQIAPREFAVLTRLGRDDAAFDLARRFALPADKFFELPARGVLLGAKFPILAKRVGLWDYWRRSGHWPDVCRDPQRAWPCGATVKTASIND